MPRPLSPGMMAAIAAGTVRPALLIEAEFLNGYLRGWTGIGPLSWNGYTWQGVGSLLGLSVINDTTEIKAENVIVTMNGLDPSMVTRILTKCRQGNPITCWLALLDANQVPTANPTIMFSGRQDVPSLDDPSTGAVSAAISVENRLRDLDRSRERRYTDQDQRSDFPGDGGFRYVAALQDWNGTTSAGGGGGNPGCPLADQWLRPDLQVRNVHESIGKPLDVMDEDGMPGTRNLLRVGGIVMSPSVRLYARNGRTACFSADTPVDTPEAGVIEAAHMYRHAIATDGGHGTPIEWALVDKVEYLGWRECLRMDFGGMTFPSGDSPTSRLYAHNKEMRPE